MADHIVALLRERGVDHVFGIPGGAISPLYDALLDGGLQVTIAQHEGMAVYLAYGHARATGRPGVVLVTAGPGALNTVTGLAAAQLDEVPLLVLAGDVKSQHAGRGALQDGGSSGVGLLDVVRPLTKRAESVTHAERALAAVQQALDATLAVPHGAVLLNLAMDVLVANAPCARVCSSIPALAPASWDLCEEIARALDQAVRPTIWLGIGARVARIGPALLRLAERTGCPVVCDIEAKGLFPESHALSLGLVGVGSRGAAERYLADADLLLTLGARLDDATTLGFQELFRRPRQIQLDHGAQRLNRAYAADLSVACDLAETTRRLAERCPSASPELMVEREAAVQATQAACVVADAAVLGRAPHDPAAVIRALQRSLPPDTVFTVDIGNHLIFAAQQLLLDEPDRFHCAQGLGGMGSGIGVAMGLASAYRSERAVLGICGDGSFRMVGSELATCAAADIPVVLAVLDDGQLGMVEHGNERVFGRSGYCTSPRVDVVGFARSLGARAECIKHASDLDAALAHRLDGPLVLHFPIRADVRASNPRSDVFAFPRA